MIIKQIGKSGQVSLGKEHAGKNVLIEEISEGVWVIKAGQFIPDNERWLHQPDVTEALNKAIEWAKQNPPKETDIDELEKAIEHGSLKH